MVNFKSCYYERQRGEKEAFWQVLWSTNRRDVYSRKAVTLLSASGYTGQICLPREYHFRGDLSPMRGREAEIRVRQDLEYIKKIKAEFLELM